VSTLFTLVGKQPAAVAVTVKTLMQRPEQPPLTRVILLTTPQTQAEADRLEIYFRDLRPELKVERRVIALDPAVPPAPYQYAWDTIRQELDRGGLTEPIYYDTTPGLNYQVALISYHLRDETRLQPLYADYDYLCQLQTGERWELADLGLQSLLQLYNLRTQPTVSDAPGVVDNLVIDLSPRPSLTLLKAQERKGRLHGLVQIWRNLNVADKKQIKKESDRIKEACRALANLTRSPQLLAFLRPILTVWTNDWAVANRCRAYGLESIKRDAGPDCPPEVLKSWQEAQSAPPRRRKPGPIEQALKFDHGPIQRPGTGQWSAPDLIIALGDDPSATLAAIFTHKPRRLVILVDETTTWVRAMAGRLSDCSQDFGAAELTFWPVNLLGQISHSAKFKQHRGEEPWQINISPGTKAQTWSLARLAGGAISLWSLDNERERSTCLTDNQPPLAYDLPPVILQAFCLGGTLADEGIPLAKIREQEEFYAACADFLAAAVANNKNIFTSWKRGVTVRIPNAGQTLTCVEVFPDEQQMELRVRNGQEYCGRVFYDPNDPKSGRWFEEVAAGALLHRFPRQIKDMRVGVRWAWLGQSENSRHFRTDLDILLRWENAYLGIECKLAVPNDQAMLEDICATVMAETRVGLGRFALPILLRGSFPKDLKQTEAITQATVKMEPLEISLSYLSKVLMSKIADWIQQALKARRTAD
jgi:hypothetical protein